MRLENKEIILDLTEKGGEMTALTLKSNNVQYLWQGDDTFWSGKNPSLFPQVGNTYTNTYEINGKTYAMKNHGFIRNFELTCISFDEHSATFQLLSNDDTLAVYPFAFDYRITYTIVKHIRNTGMVSKIFRKLFFIYIVFSLNSRDF